MGERLRQKTKTGWGALVAIGVLAVVLSVSSCRSTEIPKKIPKTQEKGAIEKPRLLVSYNESIYLMSEDGSNKRKMVEEGILPKFSPDGQKIVYNGKEKPKDKYLNHIFIYDIQTKKSSKVTKGIDPAWSPDGQKIAYVWWSPEREKEKDVIPGEGEPLYLKTININGTKEQSIAVFPMLANPCWSSDGKHIIFDTSGEEPFSAIFKVKADGSDFKTFQSSLTPDESSKEDELTYFLLQKAKTADLSVKFGIEGTVNGKEPPLPVVGDFPVYSPDGKRIAFTALSDEEPEFNRNEYELWLFDFDTESVKKLLPADDNWRGYPAWSPDGKKIAVVNKKMEGKELEDNQAIDWNKGVEIWIIDIRNPKNLKAIKMPGMMSGLDWR